MKIIELLESNQINEVPMGAFTQMRARLASKLGSTTAKANLDVGQRANELDKSFRAWALRAGIELTAVPQDDINEFLKQQNLPPVKLKQSIYNLEDKTQNTALWKGVAQATWKASGATLGSTPLGAKYGAGQSPIGAATGSSVTDVYNQITTALSTLNPQEKNQLKRLLKTV